MSKETAATISDGAVLSPKSCGLGKRAGILSARAATIGQVLIGRQPIFAILALLLGRVSLRGELLPFGLAYFVAITRLRRSLAPVIGIWVLAGCFSAGFYKEMAAYGVAMFFFYQLTGRETRLQRRMRTVPFLLMTCTVLLSFILLFWQKIVLYQWLLLGFNLAACLLLSYIFFKALPLLENGMAQPEENVACLVVLGAAAVAGVGQIELAGYRLLNIVSSLFIMLLIQEGGNGLGMAVGTTIGIAASLNEGNSVFPIACYAVSSLLAALFSQFGRFAVALGYLLGCVIAVAYFAVNGQAATVLLEAAAGAVLFFAVPAGWWKTLRQKTCRSGTADGSDRPPAVVKLSQLSELFSELAAAFSPAKYQSELRPEDDIRQLVDQLGAKICKQCAGREACWEHRFYHTYQAFLDLLSLPPGVTPDRGNLPPLLRECCMKKDELLTLAADSIGQRQAQLYWQRKSLECRSVLAEQIRSTAGIIDMLAAEIRNEPQSDEQMAACITAAAAAAGCPIEARVSGRGSALRIDAYMEPCSGGQACMIKLLPLLSEAVGSKLRLEQKCGSRSLQRKCKLVLTAANRYTLTVGAAAVAKGMHSVSGDTCSVFEAGYGRLAAVISDGMGSGSQAADDSKAAVQFLERLLAAGFSTQAAIKTVNAMLLLRLPGESYSTIDMVIFDLHSGEAEFVKTGSAVSYIKRVREVSVVQSASLPAGILEQVEIEPQKRALVPGDLVIMISDGIAEADRKNIRRDWLANFLRLAPDTSPQDLADRILAQARRLSGPVVRDDMTVLVLKLHEQFGTI